MALPGFAAVAALWFGVGETQIGHVACMGHGRVYEIDLWHGRLLRMGRRIVGVHRFGRPPNDRRA